MPRDSIATLPNLVSMSRLVMAALFPFVPGTPARLVLIAAAGVTDFLDGYLARTRGSSTRMGEMIDPFADRCFLLVAVCVLWADDVLSLTQMLVVAVRDISLLAVWIGARATGRLREFRFIARPSGKVLTVLQLATLAIAYIAPQWIMPAVIVVGLASAFAIADYGVALWRTRTRIVMLLVALGLLPLTASAQGIRFMPTVQPELRADAVFGSRGIAAVGGGLNAPAGYYVRVASMVSAGREFGPKPATAWRAELSARFLADPFAERGWGPYGGGGVALDWRDGRAGRAAIMLIAGADVPSHARWRPAIEVAVGGGTRLSVVLRRARTSGR